MGFDKHRVAACIRANRAKLGLSREEFAGMCGIPASTLGSYENAENVPSLENAWKIADACDLDMDDLFERERKAS